MTLLELALPRFIGATWSTLAGTIKQRFTAWTDPTLGSFASLDKYLLVCQLLTIYPDNERRFGVQTDHWWIRRDRLTDFISDASAIFIPRTKRVHTFIIKKRNELSFLALPVILKLLKNVKYFQTFWTFIEIFARFSLMSGQIRFLVESMATSITNKRFFSRMNS